MTMVAEAESRHGLLALCPASVDSSPSTPAPSTPAPSTRTLSGGAAVSGVVASASVPDVLSQVHALLDSMGTVDAALVSDQTGEADLRTPLTQVDRAITRLHALRLSIVGAITRTTIAEDTGHPDTSAWLASETLATGASAHADVTLAAALESELPVTRTALASGTLSAEHARVIAAAVRRLPDSLSAPDRDRVEHRLLDHATRLDPAQLRRVARQCLAWAERHADTQLEATAARTSEGTALREEESRARARTRLQMHDNHDGTMSGTFTVPSLAGAMLRRTIQQLASPRRNQAATSAPATTRAAATTKAAAAATGSKPRGTAEAGTLDWGHRYGTAFVELLEHLPTDALHGKATATVVVTISHTDLRDNLGAAHLDTGHDISASEARRLACGAGILPAVLDGQSMPLDFGRASRFFTDSHRTALATRYDTCAAEGCQRPFAWSELHHLNPWSHGGDTNLANAIPLCGWHHRLTHDPGYQHTTYADPDGRTSIRYHRSS